MYGLQFYGATPQKHSWISLGWRSFFVFLAIGLLYTGAKKDHR